jgi:cell division initiation protein
METTPNDLRQQQFEIKFRGYNPDDVEVFRDLAATALEEARASNLKLSEENNHLREQLQRLIAIEETLKAAVLEAQKNADNTVITAKREAESIMAAARREADLVLREARRRGDEISTGVHSQMGKLVNDINKIRFIRSNYLSRLKTLLDSQMQVIHDELEADGREERATKEFEARKAAESKAEPEYHRPEPPPEDETPEEEPLRDEYREENREDDRDETADAIDRAFAQGPGGKSEETSDVSVPESRAEAENVTRREQDSEDDSWKKLKEHLGED